MSEKRFTYLTGAMGVLFYDSGEMIPYPKVCDLLNSLDDENAELLSGRIKDLEHFEECVEKAKELKSENELLKQKISNAIAIAKENQELNLKLITKIDFLERIIDGDV